MIKSFLTNVMQADDSIDETAKIAERLKAAEMLAKIMGLFDKKPDDKSDERIAKMINEVFK